MSPSSLKHSANALYVLRLILKPVGPPTLRPKRRTFSTAVLSSDYLTQDKSTVILRDALSIHSSAPDSSSSTTESFLESPTPEYSFATTLLPENIPPSDPLPWPTIFPHPSSTSRAQGQTLFTEAPAVREYRCDPLAKLVLAGDLTTAKTVYNELRGLHIGILRRNIYLNAAISCLVSSDGEINSSTTHGTSSKDEVIENFFFWLELIPNRPAVAPHPKSKALYKPIIDKLILEFSDHQENLIITRFLKVSARKGVLPLVLGPLMRFLVHSMPPQESLSLMDILTQEYWDGQIRIQKEHSREEWSDRGKLVMELVRQRVDGMWNSYLRGLHTAGWTIASSKLLRIPPKGITWDQYTFESLQQPSSTMDETSRMKEFEEYVQEEKETPLTGVRIVRQVKALRTRFVRPSQLADILDELTFLGAESLIRRLEGRFLNSNRLGIWRQETWHHAALLRLLGQNKSLEALDYFTSNFIWMGLPDHPLRKNSSSFTDQRKYYPSIGVITTITPVILSTLPEPSSSLPTFHTEYLNRSRSLPPKLRPTPPTHSTILRTITHILGPDSGIEALRKTLEEGYDPGIQSYNVLLCSLAGRGKFSVLRDLLNAMQEEAEVGGRKMPKPERRTYASIADILEKKGGEKEFAQEIKDMLARQFPFFPVYFTEALTELEKEEEVYRESEKVYANA